MKITICIFAKAPGRSEVKTRLAATIGADRATALAMAFLVDTWALVNGIEWTRPVVATTGALPHGLLGEATVWPQGEGPLDARVERMLARALSDTPCAIVLGADSPGLPRTVLEEAAIRLAAGEAVIGPADDGGFYLIGVRACPRGLLAGVPWSTADACAVAAQRLTEHGMPPTLLPRWFDVDRADDLPRLGALLDAAPDRAPATAAVLAISRRDQP